MNKASLLFLSAALVAISIPRAQDSAAAPTEVPIGGIILWWGRAADIPAGFEACDGTVVTTKNAVLRGAKPNLESKFPRGAANYRNFVPQAFAGGGSDALAIDEDAVKVSVDPHKLTDAQLPAHDHTVGPLTHGDLFDHSHTVANHHHEMDHLHLGGAHTHAGIATDAIVDKITSTSLPDAVPSDPQFPYLQSVTTTTTATGGVSDPSAFKTGPSITKGGPKTQTGDTAPSTSTAGGPIAAHQETTTSPAGTSGEIPLTHQVKVTSTKLDNRPAFVDVVFLIRVK
ncbi:MAG: hypothetical protein HOP15_01895 [Planctomycetes bacterium]|nr:hypothetical protein [Planctomycetota bacterium]